MDAAEAFELQDLTDKIELGEYLGHGEEGTIYLAKYNSNGIEREVAARIITPTFMVPHPLVQIKTVKNLDSPFILHPLDFGTFQQAGKEKYVQILPLADGNLEKLADKLSIHQLVTALVHTYWGFAEALEKKVFWGWDFSLGQILIFNSDSETNILAKISDFGSFRELGYGELRMSQIPQMLCTITGAFWSKFFYRDWMANKGSLSASEYQYDLFTLNRKKEFGQNFFSEEYISSIPKSIVKEALLLGDVSELTPSAYLNQVNLVISMLAQEYNIPPYRDVDLYATALRLVGSERDKNPTLN